jgi:hypothetical protein
MFQPSYRLAIRTEGMIEDLVKNLKSADPELQMHCASAIFKVKQQAPVVRTKILFLAHLFRIYGQYKQTSQIKIAPI